MFEMLIFKSSQVIKYNVLFAFLFVQTVVYKFRKIMVRTYFSDQFRKTIMHHKRIGYDLNVMRQSACYVINQITVNDLAALFNCTPVYRASYSMMAPIKSYSF